MSNNDSSDKEAQEIMRQFNEGKQNMHSFLGKIIESDDTIKVGNISEEELGTPKLPLRTYKELELFCNDIADDNNFSEYFKKMAEVQTSTSLSKDAILLNLVNTLRKEVGDITKRRKRNSGWFSKGSQGEVSQ